MMDCLCALVLRDYIRFVCLMDGDGDDISGECRQDLFYRFTFDSMSSVCPVKLLMVMVMVMAMLR